MLKTQRSTSQQSVTQDSNQLHDCHTGQPQQPDLARRLPETVSEKQTTPKYCQHPIRWAFTSQALTR